ncbi:DEAD/DEAH box helicase [Caulobacter sp. KR2-114]|uniref:DEAD/DEAH box helicase n=1 Tax=Caulobacter sp. KR2-114 TaxID=3400912 RepID=UPI003C04D2B0
MRAQTFGTVLKRFQSDAVDNGVAIFATCLDELRAVRGTPGYEESRRLIVGDVGAILFEAPTGTGKTLMAGHVAANVSLLHVNGSAMPVLWFWIAPFAGVISQTIRTIQSEFDALRVRHAASDRDPLDVRSGDVFVTTWANVAVANTQSRKVRTATETAPSIDGLIDFARAQGFAIGAVIDEAHHSFKGQSEAIRFYREVLRPELTILVTATPRDRDLQAFTQGAGVTNLRRITVSRQQAISDRLIKEGVKVAVFKAPDDVQSLIDFRKTALRQGVETHKALKALLAKTGATVTPLLLVQVDSNENSVAEATQWLKELGFRTEGEAGLIRSHTADEPDPHLSSLVADETVEVLIFKLAVATGFDAPRAFTLVSFRPVRDSDFGVQIVGRILRVDRRLQPMRNAPTALDYGYVFLSDNGGQAGLLSAAERINAIRSELASVTPNIAVVAFGGEPETQRVGEGGQLTFFTSAGRSGWADETPGDLFERAAGSGGAAPAGIARALFDEWDLAPAPTGAGPSPRVPEERPVGASIYTLNTTLGAPRAFNRAVLSLESRDLVREVVSRFRFDEDALLVAQRGATTILMEEVEIFGARINRREEIRADLAQKEIDARAQQTLFRADDYQVIDIRALHSALVDQLGREASRRGIDHVFDTPQKLRAGLHKILALRPQQLRRAISETVARYTISEAADVIPAEIVSTTQLQPARLNLYGVFPDDLNGWERPFAEYLDDDLTGTVLWWHRNPPRKPFSVSVPLPGQPDFYPDFIVGVRDRARGDGVLLVETKRMINDQERNALVKAQASHPDYGPVMMLYWEDRREWRVVEYDARADRNFLDRALRPELLATY